MSHAHKRNALSILGRMGYTTHLLFYPGAAALYIYVIKPYMKHRNEEAEKKEWEGMPKAKVVDPDLFNPFSAIPYHNNPELPYVFAHIHLHNYANKNHINVNDYVWKNFHNSYDYNNTNPYLYNWASMSAPDENNSYIHGTYGK